eukprot:TRINITY_DN72343_c0_g1_i1.p1 TRINITY_DN72343_c0_g1~~TRINITY_DN72343_c0_g1_i1.p1  ORF type:complete len:211 (+),score=30.93 TRINITY_DN72343_c0_g1_i1:65-697(+)
MMEEEQIMVPLAEPVRLAQSEAIMEAIIRSSKPLPISPAGAGSRISFPHFAARWQPVVDRLVPWLFCRWISFAALLAGFCARVLVIQRHFLIAYVLAICLLNQLMLFITPAMEDDGLPVPHNSDEYRPFLRAISEFKLWSRIFASVAAAFGASFVDDLDMDVDGGTLVLFFVLLFFYTMKQQIMHMVKHSYVPWSGRKTRQNVKEAAYDV